MDVPRPEALGPPAELAAKEDELTPMMSEYARRCREYDDALVLYQVGDFYKCFCEAAAEISRLLDLTLTEREDSTGTYRMTGIPVENAATYVETLLSAGYRVAIAEQVEDPEEVTGVVERAVTQVVTPGTVVDDELLEPGTSNYVAALTAEDRVAAAFVDVSTGEFVVTGGDREIVLEELARFDPAEVLVGPGLPDDVVDAPTPPFDRGFDAGTARDLLGTHVGRVDALVESTAELRAAGAALAYAEYTQGGDDGDLGDVSRLRRYDPDEYVRLDGTVIESLELFEPRHGDGPALFDVVDDTVSALGRRRLADWLRRPLSDPAGVRRRLDAVAELVEDSLTREEVRARMEDVRDAERLVTRVSRNRADARDLRALEATLGAVEPLEDALGGVESDLLVDLRDGLDGLEKLRERIDAAIVPDPPAEITDGGLIREGFDDDLDRLRTTKREGQEWVENLEARERERTGIDSLSVGHNEVHGYYIEVTEANLDRVPDDYTRRQTLKNAERFYTPELKEREDEILSASERADAREQRLFREVRETVAAEADRVRDLAERLGKIDALAALAAVALDRDYTLPEVGADGIRVEGGRHPVVETTTEFVPNGLALTDDRMAVITGPNMSGKSTYMRQVALIALLAQAGSFVPADAARLPVFDRIFTRVGASDDIAGGESTFMREMSELSTILHSATEDSLVLLDEVGRGTSTADGLAIARAATEFLHDEVRAWTLFATHYHELTEVAEGLQRACNLHFDADRTGEEVTFFHQVTPGAAGSSYGVEVAKLAGVPEPVVARSRELATESDAGDPDWTADDTWELTEGKRRAALEAVEKMQRLRGESHMDDEAPSDRGGAVGETAGDADGTVADGGADALTDAERRVVETVAGMDLATTTPLEALTRLHDLQDELDDTG